MGQIDQMDTLDLVENYPALTLNFNNTLYIAISNFSFLRRSNFTNIAHEGKQLAKLRRENKKTDTFKHQIFLIH